MRESAIFSSTWTFGVAHFRRRRWYGVVPKGLLTFLGSLCKEVAKTTPELWYIASRDKPPEKKKKKKKLDLECRILSQEPLNSCILYFNVVFHGK